MALDSRTKTMIIASVAAAVMVVAALAVWKQVFFGKRPVAEAPAASTEGVRGVAPGLDKPSAPPAQPVQEASPAQPQAASPQAAPAGGQQVAPARPGEKTLDQIFAEKGPLSAQDTQEAVRAPVVKSAPEADAAKAPAKPAPNQTAQAGPTPDYRPMESAQAAEPKVQDKAEPAVENAAKSALEEEMERQALGLPAKKGKPGKEQKPEPKAAPEKAADKSAKGKPAKASDAEAKPAPAAAEPAKAPASDGKGKGKFSGATVSADGDTVSVKVAASAVPAKRAVMFVDVPVKVVVDLPGQWEHDGPGEVKGAGFVQRVRIGKHPDKLRVVLDTTIPSSAGLSGKVSLSETPGGLTITVKK